MIEPENDLERRQRGRDVRVLAADEHRQRALARALGAARDGRVDRAAALRQRAWRRSAATVRRRDRRAVDEHGAGRMLAATPPSGRGRPPRGPASPTRT